MILLNKKNGSANTQSAEETAILEIQNIIIKLNCGRLIYMFDLRHSLLKAIGWQVFLL